MATIPLHADVSDAAAIRAKRSVRRLPVVDEDDTPHGMVALDDLVRHLGREADAVAETVIPQAFRPGNVGPSALVGVTVRGAPSKLSEAGGANDAE